MTITELYILYKAPHLTAEQFKYHYETVHVPLVSECIGDPNDMPLLYKRHYVIKADTESKNPGTPDFDAVTTITFRDQAARDKFIKTLTSPGIAEKLASDSAAFQDVSRAQFFSVETSELV